MSATNTYSARSRLDCKGKNYVTLLRLIPVLIRALIRVNHPLKISPDNTHSRYELRQDVTNSIRTFKNSHLYRFFISLFKLFLLTIKALATSTRAIFSK